MVSVGLTFYLSVHITTQGNFVAGRPRRIPNPAQFTCRSSEFKDRRQERQTRKGVEGENGKIATLPVQAAFVHACADQLWPQPCRGVQFCP
jgi:hypothetical protein